MSIYVYAPDGKTLTAIYINVDKTPSGLFINV